MTATAATERAAARRCTGYDTFVMRDGPQVVVEFVHTIDAEFGGRDSVAGCVAHLVLALERIDEATK